MANVNIVVDIGHDGNYNPGIIPGYYESKQMWKLGQYFIEDIKERSTGGTAPP